MAFDVDLTTVGAVCGIAASVWLITRDVVPVVVRMSLNITRFVKRKHAENQAATAQRYAESSKLVKHEERLAAFNALEASVDQLRLMEQRRTKYHKVEWKRQIRDCKERTVRYLSLKGTQIAKDKYTLGPLPIQSGDGTIIIAWEPSEWNRGKVQIDLYWHPNSLLTHEELIRFRFAHEPREHLKVFSRPLTDGDMNAVGWEYPDIWARNLTDSES